MTIPEGAGLDTPTPDPSRVTRPEPVRTGPDRARAAAAEPPAPHPPLGATMSDEAAKVVRDGYAVIMENIRQGRIAAERFRDGQYSMREIPGDLSVVGLRMLGLARELSMTTFDVCERLLKETGPAAAGQAPRTAPPTPPFRPTVSRTPQAPSAQATPPDAGRLKLTVRFTGEGAAKSPTTSLERPAQPTAPEEIAVTPLTPRLGGGPPITGVSFTVDVALGGLIATVSVPSGQGPGVYSGLVYAGPQETPLGVLTVEIQP